jgi:hypothetical protein
MKGGLVTTTSMKLAYSINGVGKLHIGEQMISSFENLQEHLVTQTDNPKNDKLSLQSPIIFTFTEVKDELTSDELTREAGTGYHTPKDGYIYIVTSQSDLEELGRKHSITRGNINFKVEFDDRKDAVLEVEVDEVDEGSDHYYVDTKYVVVEGGEETVYDTKEEADRHARRGSTLVLTFDYYYIKKDNDVLPEITLSMDWKVHERKPGHRIPHQHQLWKDRQNREEPERMANPA